MLTAVTMKTKKTLGTLAIEQASRVFSFLINPFRFPPNQRKSAFDNLRSSKAHHVPFALTTSVGSEHHSTIRCKKQPKINNAVVAFAFSLRYYIARASACYFNSQEETMNIILSEQLKKLRREKGNTQEDLAKHLGISVQAVSKWERDVSHSLGYIPPRLRSRFRASSNMKSPKKVLTTIS